MTGFSIMKKSIVALILLTVLLLAAGTLLALALSDDAVLKGTFLVKIRGISEILLIASVVLTLGLITTLIFVMIFAKQEKTEVILSNVPISSQEIPAAEEDEEAEEEERTRF